MEWNAKSCLLWDWDSPPPAAAAADFGLLTGGGGGGASSGSELGNAGSSKTSIDSSSRVGDEVLGDEGNAMNQERQHLWQDSVLAADEGPKDLTMGLKLGKRTYFEDAVAENDVKAPLAQLAPALVKKTRVSHQSVCCQVEGCTDDLSTAKNYHRKHRICEAHSKCPLVIVAGQERRFCQQCSRFHALSKFDQKKRSCRRRLSDHNARRRKPQPEIISFNSTALPSLSYANKQQMNFLWSKVPDSLRNNGISKWESSYAFKFPRENGLWQKTTKAGGSGGTLHLPNPKLYGDFSTRSHELDGLLPLKGTAEVLNQGSEPSIVTSNLDGAPDLRRALSLLSVDSWVPPEHGQASSLAQLMDPNHTGSAQSMVQVVDSTSDCLQDAKPSTMNAHVFPFALQSNGGQLTELQLHKAPYGTSFFGSSQIH